MALQTTLANQLPWRVAWRQNLCISTVLPLTWRENLCISTVLPLTWRHHICISTVLPLTWMRHHLCSAYVLTILIFKLSLWKGSPKTQQSFPPDISWRPLSQSSGHPCANTSDRRAIVTYLCTSVTALFNLLLPLSSFLIGLLSESGHVRLSSTMSGCATRFHNPEPTLHRQ